MDSGTEVTDAAGRAQELRTSLGARRDVEEMLAEASRLRTAAAAEADALVEEAQQVSEALVTESRQRADDALARARADAADSAEHARLEGERVRAEAEAGAEAYREQVRAEVAEQLRAQIGDAEGEIRSLRAQLETAMTSVDQTLSALAELRGRTGDGSSGVRPPVVEADDTAEETNDDDGGPAPAYGSVPPPAVAAQAPAFAVPAEAGTAPETPDPSERSLAERFPEPTSERAEAPALGAGFMVIPESERPTLAEVPRTGAPARAEVPVPTRAVAPEQVSILAAAREEMESDARSEHTTLAVEPEPDPVVEETPARERVPRDSEAPSRPLGWLFRSAH